MAVRPKRTADRTDRLSLLAAWFIVAYILLFLQILLHDFPTLPVILERLEGQDLMSAAVLISAAVMCEPTTTRFLQRRGGHGPLLLAYAFAFLGYGLGIVFSVWDNYYPALADRLHFARWVITSLFILITTGLVWRKSGYELGT